MFILDDILLAPVKGLVWLCEKLDEVAEKELSDEGRIKEELMALQLQFELDQISEQEYNQKEQELLARLDTLVKAREKEP